MRVALCALITGLTLLTALSSADARSHRHHHHHRHHAHHHRHVHHAHHHVRHRVHKATIVDYGVQQGSGGNYGLVSQARRYIGTNPTGWAHVWCGKFMAMLLPQSARRIGNANLAMNWAHLPRTSPRVGAIAVMTRRGGGHVGVVSGFDRSGNPIIVAGNASGHKVREYAVARGRVVAWVTP